MFIHLELKDCESYATNDHKYSFFYDLHTINDNQSEGCLVDLKIFAIAQKDVYILLTPTTDITNETVFYEFGM